MDSPKQSLMMRQIARVNQRLFLQLFVNRVIACWAGALALAALWFLLQPWLIEAPPSWLRWTVAGSLLGLGTLLAGLLAALAAPSRVMASLSLDEKFGLNERVTTSMMLTSEQLGTPAGQALLDDVNTRIEKLDISGRFPIMLSWTAAMIPACAMILALVALFYQPNTTPANAESRDLLNQAPVNSAEINQKMAALKKVVRPRSPNEAPKSEELERIEADLDKIANKPRDTREQLKQRMAEMQQVEDKIRERQEKLADKSNSMKNQLKQMDAASQKSKDGPTKDLEKALAQGDLAKAQQEMDKLAKKVQDNELTPKEKEQLKERLADMQNKLQQAARQKDKEEELRKLEREGKINKETLERELANLDKEREKLKDLDQLAQQLGECKNCLEKGDKEGAADKLGDAGKKLKEMQLNDKEMQDLDGQLQRMQEAKDSLEKGDKEGKDGKGGTKGDKSDKDGKGANGGEAGGKGDGKGDTDQPNDGGIGEGKRPLGKDGATKSYEARQKTEFNKDGKKIFDGFAPGENFKARPGPDVADAVKQAAQEAPEAIEQQRIPKASRDMAKRYFKNLGGQDDKPAGKPAEKK